LVIDSSKFPARITFPTAVSGVYTVRHSYLQPLNREKKRTTNLTATVSSSRCRWKT